MRREIADEEQSKALTLTFAVPTPTLYLQNLATGAVHAIRASGGEYTICGWFVGVSRVSRGGLRCLTTVVDIPHWPSCERCLLSERGVAELLSEQTA